MCRRTIAGRTSWGCIGFTRRCWRGSKPIPGVESAAIAASHPLNPGFTNSFVIVGREEESRDLPEMSMRHVSPGYFRTLGVKLLRGRLLDDRDGSTAPPVVVVNEAAANRVFGGAMPSGN